MCQIKLLIDPNPTIFLKGHDSGHIYLIIKDIGTYHLNKDDDGNTYMGSEIRHKSRICSPKTPFPFYFPFFNYGAIGKVMEPIDQCKLFLSLLSLDLTNPIDINKLIKGRRNLNPNLRERLTSLMINEKRYNFLNNSCQEVSITVAKMIGSTMVSMTDTKAFITNSIFMALLNQFREIIISKINNIAWKLYQSFIGYEKLGFNDNESVQN